MRKDLKWFIPIILVIAFVIYLFSSSGMGKIASDLTQAYAEQELYTNAIGKANSNQEVIESIGKIEPIGKITILNGEVNFTDNNSSVTSTIKVNGTKGGAKMDITAIRENGNWRYEKIDLRIKAQGKDKKSIEVIGSH